MGFNFEMRIERTNCVAVIQNVFSVRMHVQHVLVTLETFDIRMFFPPASSTKKCICFVEILCALGPCSATQFVVF